MATLWTVFGTATFVLITGVAAFVATRVRRQEQLKQAAYQRLERKVFLTEAIG